MPLMTQVCLTSNPDDIVHVVPNFIKCTLAEISDSTHLRVDDIAIAMLAVGFISPTEIDDDEGRTQTVVLISRAMVEQVASERNLPTMC